jgi:hypothetical protein
MFNHADYNLHTNGVVSYDWFVNPVNYSGDKLLTGVDWSGMK